MLVLNFEDKALKSARDIFSSGVGPVWVYRGMAVKRQGFSGVKKRGCLSEASSAFQTEKPREQAMERLTHTGPTPDEKQCSPCSQ